MLRLAFGCFFYAYYVPAPSSEIPDMVIHKCDFVALTWLPVYQVTNAKSPLIFLSRYLRVFSNAQSQQLLPLSHVLEIMYPLTRTSCLET